MAMCQTHQCPALSSPLCQTGAAADLDAVHDEAGLHGHQMVMPDGKGPASFQQRQVRHCQVFAACNITTMMMMMVMMVCVVIMNETMLIMTTVIDVMVLPLGTKSFVLPVGISL